jgi:Root hair defective 3 GTP-binding protein (RHD3)
MFYVFHVNILRSTSGRTLLLFVIRDHIATPLENLQATLTADIQRIWDTLSKPADLRDRQLSDYFDLAFTALPHKLLLPDKFESDVQTLRQRFANKEQGDYLFKPVYHKRIPADGVAFYMEGIWVSLIKCFGDRWAQFLIAAGTSANEQGSRSAHPARTFGPIPV